jgi:hypothetical protein
MRKQLLSIYVKREKSSFYFTKVKNLIKFTAYFLFEKEEIGLKQ